MSRYNETPKWKKALIWGIIIVLLGAYLFYDMSRGGGSSYHTDTEHFEPGW